MKTRYARGMKSKPKHTFYSLSILLSLVGSAGFVIALIILHYYNLAPLLPQGLLDFLLGTQCLQLTATLVSGHGYLAQWIDRFTSKTTSPQSLKQRLHAEKIPLIGLSLGILLAITLTLVQVVKHLPGMRWLSGLGSAGRRVLGFISNLSSAGGLGNRVSRVVSLFKEQRGKPHPLRTTDINYTLAIVGGLLVGVALAGVMIATAGAGLPVILGAFAAMATTASAAGYLGRVADTFLGNRVIGQKALPQKSLRERLTLESKFTMAGVSLGVVIGIALVVAGVATLPFFGLGSVKIIAGILLFTSCVSSIGGLGNRIGHAAQVSVAPIVSQLSQNARLHKTLRLVTRPKCLNGILPCGKERGIPTKEDTDQHRHTKSGQGSQPEHGKNPVIESCNQVSDQQPKQHTEAPTEHRQHHRFGQK